MPGRKVKKKNECRENEKKQLITRDETGLR